MQRAVVFGVTGRVGSPIAAALLRSGFLVTGVARHPHSDDSNGRLTMRSGSLYDAEFAFAQTERADAIVVAVPAIGDPLPAFSVLSIGLVAAVPLLLALSRTSGARLGFVGAFGQLNLDSAGPLVLTDEEIPVQERAEALAHAELLEALHTQSDEEDWFYASPSERVDSRGTRERFAEIFADEFEHPHHRQDHFVISV